MNYAEVSREVYNRIAFHSRQGGMLDGLKLRKTGEYQISGVNDLPCLTFIDMSCSDSRGKGTGTITTWLRVDRSYGWFSDVVAGDPREINAKPGLIDWQLAIMDAVETKPSDGVADQLLVAHDQDGKALVDNHNCLVNLLVDPFGWTCSMEEISDIAFTMSMNLDFAVVATKRGRRRFTPSYRPLRER